MALFKKTVNALGGVYDNGVRVYSANNPPPGGGGGASTAVANTWTAQQTFQAPDAATAPVLVKAAADHTGMLEAWTDSANVVLAYLNAAGQYHEGGRRLSAITSRLTTAATTTANSYAASGLSLALSAGKVYRVKARGQYRTTATTCGLGLRLGGTATALGVRYETWIYGLTATTYTHQAVAALGTTQAASTAVLAANTDYGFSIEGLIRVNAAGNLTLDFMAEVAGQTATIQPDSTFEAVEVA